MVERRKFTTLSSKLVVVCVGRLVCASFEQRLGPFIKVVEHKKHTNAYDYWAHNILTHSCRRRVDSFDVHIRSRAHIHLLSVVYRK
jgi:hypothetical protein